MANLHKFTVQEALNRPTEALSSILTADGQVKATAGSVLAVMVSVNGVTAADKIEIKNSADNSGTALLSFVANPTAQLPLRGYCIKTTLFLLLLLFGAKLSVICPIAE